MSDRSYVVRFGWTLRDVIMVPACAAFVLLGALSVADEPVMGVLCILLGGLYLALLLTAWASRRAALAVTEEGITLGALPPWPASKATFVPWSYIDAVVLWRQRTVRVLVWRQSIYYIGVERRAGAPPQSGLAQNRALRKVGKAFVPGDVSEDLMVDSRQISFWRLDRERLAAAVDHFAPDVRVEDRT
ncbi:hypothetical protein GCM10009557_82880 [Virgisporangium ochraceum]|uniref:PH domain-containing protein n=1 Tax=Virgisporangium ochraceum TaxID=65505 RepID=A0A8J4ECQ0_9ACTN|nr:hypothetical protein [Virgisporangium ochraceum]GIJ69733.1 hypothetical protein Voc01_046500 [Virgisporangium ochraceum]